MADDVQLTDLEVVQRWSLAVRAASAPRDELVAALEADLAWLTDGARRRPAARRAAVAPPAAEEPAPPRKAARRAPRKAAPREA